jgi:hypothetical protein
MAGACPELSKAGTARIPHKPKKEAVILYRRIVSEKGPTFKISGNSQYWF